MLAPVGFSRRFRLHTSGDSKYRTLSDLTCHISLVLASGKSKALFEIQHTKKIISKLPDYKCSSVLVGNVGYDPVATLSTTCLRSLLCTFLAQIIACPILFIVTF
jgi:hypothetical protein